MAFPPRSARSARTPPTVRKSQGSAKKQLSPRGATPKPRTPSPSKGLFGKGRNPPIPGGGALPTPPSMDLPGGTPRLPSPRMVPASSAFSINAPPLNTPSPPVGVGHMSNANNPKGRGGAVNMSEKRDKALDRKAGIKEGSKKDLALDKKRGLPKDKK